MKTNVYGTAAAILRIVTEAPDHDAPASDVQRKLSKGQLTQFESALTLLVEQGDVSVGASTHRGPGRPGRRIRALRTPPPEPHCTTCTCYGIL